jgi:ADP-ribose pyrophosphatase
MSDADEVTLYKGKHLKIVRVDSWEFVERTNATGAVAVIAVTDEGNLLLVEQYRAPVDSRVLDLPAGLTGDSEQKESDAETARRELLEETGFECSGVTFLTRGPSSAGILSEMVSIYRADGVRRKSEGGGVDGEAITVREVPLTEIETWLERRAEEGDWIDNKVWVGLYFLSRERERGEAATAVPLPPAGAGEERT